MNIIYRTPKRVKTQERTLLKKIINKIPRKNIDGVKKRSVPASLYFNKCILEYQEGGVVVIDEEVLKKEKKEIEEAILEKYI